MNSADSTQNFSEREGVKYVKELLNISNQKLGDNKKMNLPEGNNTPVLPTRYRYRLAPQPNDKNDDGIYFHYDDEYYYYVKFGKNRNLASRKVIDKYGIQLDTVLNIFIQPHHPDSVASPTYKKRANTSGIALRNGVKITGVWESDAKTWDVARTLNHEIGHLLSLGHTWGYMDGCDDTPNHPNCYGRTGVAPCDGVISNNMMDYNHSNSALSPCQIGKVHRFLEDDKKRQRAWLQERWCVLNKEKSITIRDTVHWKGSKDLEGHLTIEENGILQISCRVSMPKKGKITVRPGGKLILDNAKLHNDCGDEWQGILIQENGRKKGEVLIIDAPMILNAKNF